MNSKDSFCFKIGNLECLIIKDAIVSAGTLSPKPGSSQYSFQPTQTLDTMCLLIKTTEHLILIDTGHGVGEQHTAGKLLQNLQENGIGFLDIDMVILSHGHADHIGGLTNADGKVAFPNARYIMSKKEWEFWTSDPNLTHLHVEESRRQRSIRAVRKNLISIQSQFDLVDEKIGGISGIELISAPGHTPGLVVPVISSGTNQLFCISDLFHDQSDVAQPDHYSALDLLPEQAVRTRTQILSRIVQNKALVFANHFSFPGLGHIIQDSQVWLWQPIKLKG
jgi:glyoxylase-like metal-dependent hydrolase (beta-lactamase superfamily II)